MGRRSFSILGEGPFPLLNSPCYHEMAGAAGPPPDLADAARRRRSQGTLGHIFASSSPPISRILGELPAAAESRPGRAAGARPAGSRPDTVAEHLTERLGRAMRRPSNQGLRVGPG